MDQGPKSDEANEGIFREEADGLGQGGLEKGHLLLDDTSVDHEHEYRRGRTFLSGSLVLDGGVLREELGREVVVADGGVVRWEVVALEAEGADPDLGGKINDGERVKHGAASTATEGRVREDGRVRKGFDRSVNGGDGDHTVAGLLLGAWEHIPRHSHAVLSFQLYETENVIALLFFFLMALVMSPWFSPFGIAEYINELVKADEEGGRMICCGTFLNPGSWNASLLAAGTTLSAMKHILDGHGKLAYALVRPPGHHAQPTQADGYCFLNNAGLAIQLALDSGCRKVAVIDIDVHYGNGTAEGFYQSDRDRGYKYAMSELVIPAINKFEPDMLVMVVGQDSSAFDPNGRQCLTLNGYRMIGGMTRSLANGHCSGRLLIVQEGGYHITYSAYCLHATLEGVLSLPLPLLSDPIAYYPEDEAFAVKVVESIKKFQKDNVPFLKGA
ncbi:hypothetical protein GH714_035014 [Hevea brasiliensis]|uniref:Histone deacetylase domain-containing protein n=1 Tax=Hevea brasiliensis TaxID=3981 RepID=A0A6A6MFT0_HEVBR|nr:hypothetical protein GH714_035014 [Hevea brasiliensis]